MENGDGGASVTSDDGDGLGEQIIYNAIHNVAAAAAGGTGYKAMEVCTSYPLTRCIVHS
jgi:hypothetical protein